MCAWLMSGCLLVFIALPAERVATASVEIRCCRQVFPAQTRPKSRPSPARSSAHLSTLDCRVLVYLPFRYKTGATHMYTMNTDRARTATDPNHPMAHHYSQAKPEPDEVFPRLSTVLPCPGGLWIVCLSVCMCVCARSACIVQGWSLLLVASHLLTPRLCLPFLPYPS